jgi:hypothetical protein
MANEEHLARLKHGVDAWNQWRAANPDIVPDLSSIKRPTRARPGSRVPRERRSTGYSPP